MEYKVSSGLPYFIVLLKTIKCNKINKFLFVLGFISLGVPDSIINDIIVDRLSKNDMQNGFLFDGYPRTHAQAVDLDEILKQVSQ